jgi:hypothetical protein
MIKPLLRTIPTMSGNVKIACTLLDYNKISKDTFETNIRGAHLFPLSSQLFQKSVKVSLLNSSYEYDLKRFYSAYSDTFYSPCFEYDKTDIKMLDRSSVVYTRNTDFEYGVKRISYVKSGCQFACFAPIYIDNVDDIPSYFMINVEIHSPKQTVTKHIRVNLGINGSSDYNYIYKYLKKYLSNIDDNVIYMDNTDKSLTYYGIDVVNGGFTKSTDATVKNLFDIHMPIQMFDRTISIGFERNNVAIRQVLPLAFYFNVQDIFSETELVKFKYADMTFSGAYFDKNGKELKWYDFDWNYSKYSNDILKMNTINGIVQPTSGYTSNILSIGFPSLYDKYLTNYQFANKLTTTFSRWKLKYSTDEWPYITNMSWAFSNNQDSTYKYREFPTTFTNQAGYAIIDERNKYNLIFPLGPDIKTYNDINPRSSKKYEAIMNNYCLNWFELFYDKDSTGLPIEELVKLKKEDIEWSDVNEGYTYYKGVLYNFNLIYDKVTDFKEENKIDKFAFIVHPDTMNIINDENKDFIRFVSLSILPGELNTTEQILNNCILNKDILDSFDSEDNYIPLFDIYSKRKTDNLLFNEIFDVIQQEDIEESFNDDEPIFINSNDIDIDIYKSNSLIKPDEYPGLYKLANLKYIKPINGETYFGAHFINALISIFNSYEHIDKEEIVKEKIKQISVVPDKVLFEHYIDPNDYVNQDALVYSYYEDIKFGDNIIFSKISDVDKENLSKIAKVLFYSDNEGRLVLDLISDFYFDGLTGQDANNKGEYTTIKRNELKVDLSSGKPLNADGTPNNNVVSMFDYYSYFNIGPKEIDTNGVGKAHYSPKVYKNDPVLLLLSIAETVSEAMKMYQSNEDFGDCFPFIFNDYGYELWELLPIFRGKLFTNIDGKVLTSLQNAIKTYNDPNESSYDHLVKDIYINYNKYHSFNPEKLIYKSGENVLVNDVKYQDLLNSTYEHTLYYKSKFVDDTFLENQSTYVNTRFFGPFCLTNEIFPLGDITNKGTGTCTLFYGINRIISLIIKYIGNIINNAPMNERFFYYPAKYYNKFNVGSNVVYKINDNWNEYANDTVYGENMDNNVLYVHPYNFSKIMHNAITEEISEIRIDAEKELNNYLDTNTTTYYTNAKVTNTGSDIIVSYDTGDIQINGEDLDGKTYDGEKYERFEQQISYKTKYDTSDENIVKGQIQSLTKYQQKVNTDGTTDGMFRTENVSGITINESDKVEIFGKVYDSAHLNVLLNMTDEDFSCVTGFKEVTNEDGTQSIAQIVDKIGKGGKENRFYEQHKRMYVDANTGYVKVKYEYIPIDFDKKYIVQDLNLNITELRRLSVLLEDENANLTENETLEIKEMLSQNYSIVSYMGLILFDSNSGMFKKHKIVDKIKNKENPLYYLMIEGKDDNGNREFKNIINKDTLEANTDYTFAEVANNLYTYEYFNIVERNTFIKINQTIKDYINIEDEHLYKDMYIYRPLLDIEYDEKFSFSSKTEAIIKDLNLDSDSIITDTATMLYPCFNTIYNQKLNTTLLQLNIAVDNIRNVNLVKPKDLPNMVARNASMFNSSYVSDSYYRYVLKDSALFIAVTREKYEDLMSKSLTYEIPEYDDNNKLLGSYLYGYLPKGSDTYVFTEDKRLYNINTEEVFWNYPDTVLNDGKIETVYIGTDTTEKNKHLFELPIYIDGYVMPETDRDSKNFKCIQSNGLKYYIKGEPLYRSVKIEKHIPLYIQPVYKRRYIPNPVYFSSNDKNETYRENNINTFTSNDGTVYGYYLLNSIVDNSSNTLNIRATLDTNTSIKSYGDIDQISNINYVSIINDNDITTVKGLKYYLTVFRQLCPFMYNNITAKMLSVNTIMSPNTFNVTNTYATKQSNVINHSNEKDLVYVKQTILSAKKQILQRYTNSIVPHIYECLNIDNLYNLKLKECKATLLDTGNYISIGDSTMYSSSESINTFAPYSIYGVSNDSNTPDYKNAIDLYTPIEYKYFNASRMLNLETSISISSTKRYTYEDLLVAQSDETTYNIFKNYIKRLLILDEYEILFLYNKYEKTYETKVIGMSLDNTKKLYKLTYKFNLL